ncbi:MAG: alpha/beta hydrolase [Burkholderiaceae bacterium]|nr:alpha/beta hydrolase [Burkholderiaceae bacterium]
MSLQQDPYIVGSGARKVICLNGWFGHARGWGPFMDCLDGDEFTYAFLDYRGYGERMGSGGPYTIEQMAQDALDMADHLGWHAFALLGHSMGGSVAQYVLAEAPERVQTLVAVAPVPASGVPFDDQGWAYFSNAAGDVTVRRGIIDLTTGNRRNSAWLDQMAQTSMSHSDPEAFAAYLTAWAKTNFVQRIQDKPTPVLVIAGAHDPALGEETCKATWMQHYHNIELKVLANSGHYPMDEVPAEFAGIVEDYLRHHMSR